MKNDNTYNGWTNYETWRVNLELFNGDDEAWRHGNLMVCVNLQSY